ncbi:MAG: glucans biosynthesis glucosyltransferase MdoH [Pseudophaeobacter sp. bin_em_oilr2.035]|uniref:Glucans biosynthesis glucosyltransferase H n=1 Tax=Phaeobacter gallaeciensis TaxID=60890 RepID=A0ABD4X6B4_9RHOB|nr:glucans biosynthesis glucosyltransferase MdoH [Phaeobacter gallaeciensis]MDF1771122.1 glucans biosynthesis glucosyltransferase MdoH [Pseudophaeobacter sp. bin_em_oilr2.035]MDE4143948.1 glucans biosynthesis glucosyltransferase MdoH [Phaeobacter gallaeciensis]MDE4155690.1 glucans biosynthesis glucosyltransferase MdoH [Phaeobacter gallaeciensis]MDE4159878.1 glucans biosynthesis glucosyltransferase MdoH [Phaeobacter gallaeciensis]MDE4165028.1 glucans biosynthesis glucosyltransferase MdoH [Phaeo
MKDLISAPSAAKMLPPEQPMAMPEQNFGAAFRDMSAPGTAPQMRVALWRVIAFSPAMVATALLTFVMQGWFADGGFMMIEVLLLALIAFNFFWICFSVSTVLLGLFSLWQRRQEAERRVPTGPIAPDTPPLTVAVLVPVHNEDPAAVFGNARTMLEDLHAWGGAHDYAMFILSDTRDDRIAAQELAGVEALRAALPPGIRLYYRRREDNTGRKAGNIADWVRRWGGGYDAMLVLDADSLMTGRAIAQLADALRRDPAAGLIQSFPQLIGARSVFGRMQQFANGVYGLAMAEGLARWVGAEGNYWGHNAILRTRAFAACAGLPELQQTFGGKTLIMSHDFVEAGLLRRAGWGVHFLPQIQGSYEETPPTLIDHILRDRRWCQGNLQHLKLLRAQGFCAISRFHLLHGAIGYLMAPIWFALLVIWALIGEDGETSALQYFSPTDPLRPSWPDMSEPRHVAVILVIYAMLLAPKLLALAALPLTGTRLSDYGGGRQFALSIVSEILLAILYAPILMVQQMIAVLRSALRLQRGWAPQARDGGRYGLKTMLICHALEFTSGLALSAGILAGMVSVWLAPIALSLVLVLPLSALSGMRPALRLRFWMGTREVFAEPRIARTARTYRKAVERVFAGAPDHRSAAE